MSGSAPWVAGDLVITAEALAAVEKDALACYPDESCGFLMGPAATPALLDQAQRETNEADKYHTLDPQRFPRTARTYFKMNELRAASAFEAQAAKGQPIKVIYHSHCDTGAHFSNEDADTFAHGGSLTWPCAFLVVSVVDGEVRDRKLWAYSGARADFVETTLTIRG